MDYSLLLGIHDCTRFEAEGYEPEDIEGINEEEDDSEGGGAAGERIPWGTTPPDSPLPLYRETSLQYDGAIVPELDIYAIPSSESTYFSFESTNFPLLVFLNILKFSSKCLMSLPFYTLFYFY